KSAQIREILISESAWEEMTCLFAPSKGNVFEGIADYNSKTPRVRANYIFKFMERYNRRLQRNGKMMQLNAWTGLDRVKQNPPEVTGKLANNSHQQSWQSYR
ncbi:hypothetical protein RAG41_24615, partial [Klebsiella pneumoniae]